MSSSAGASGSDAGSADDPGDLRAKESKPAAARPELGAQHVPEKTPGDASPAPLEESGKTSSAEASPTSSKRAPSAPADAPRKPEPSARMRKQRPQHSEPQAVTLERKLDNLPTEPGVYVFSDEGARIIYVGKATNLRSRVRSYFADGANDGRPLFRFIVRHTADLECIVCANELEALILENNLIKKHRPRYNIRLRDDKTYLSLRVTTQEKWPRVQLLRRWVDDGNIYFGPYSSAQSVREMLRVIKKYIPLRTCSNGFFDARTRPCLEHEIGRCSAPCVGLITRETYQELVDETVLFLRGKNQTLLPLLEERMAQASGKRDYERAGKIRDQIAAIRRVMERQNVQEVRLGDLDIFGFHRRHDFVSIQVLLNRDGKLVHSTTHSFRTPLNDREVFTSFLAQFYAHERYLPPEVLLPFAVDDESLLVNWLTSRRGSKVKIYVPQRGSKHDLVVMANRNAEVNSSSDEQRTAATTALATSLGEKLGLPGRADRVECYDISGIQGTLQVASRVVFEGGEPDTSLYRRYKIRTVQGTDDFASMLEVLLRRFRKSGRRDPAPDLIVVDGGKGQITSAQKALEAAGVQVPFVGLAKDRLKKGRHTTERVFVPGRSEPLDLAEDSPESLFLQRVRDEAHRFANRYHRELRRKRTLSSGLEEVPGVGAKRRRALLKHFGSLKALRHAPEVEIAAVPGMSAAAAKATFEFLHDEELDVVDLELVEQGIPPDAPEELITARPAKETKSSDGKKSQEEPEAPAAGQEGQSKT